jgi:hypothetical protein
VLDTATVLRVLINPKGADARRQTDKELRKAWAARLVRLAHIRHELKVNGPNVIL